MVSFGENEKSENFLDFTHFPSWRCEVHQKGLHGKMRESAECEPTREAKGDALVLEELMLFPLDSVSPSLVVSERVTILLEERIDTRDTTVPRVFEIFEGESSVLSVRLFALQGVLGPNSSRIEELCLPRLDVTEQVGDEATDRRSASKPSAIRWHWTHTSEFPPPMPARK